MILTNPISTDIGCIKASKVSLQKAKSKYDHNNDGDLMFSQLYRTYEYDNREGHHLIKCKSLRSLLRRASISTIETRAPPLLSSKSSDRTKDSNFRKAVRLNRRVHFDCRKDQVHTIEPSLLDTSELWWNRIELEQHRNHDIHMKENSDKNGNDNPLKTFLLAYQVIRDEFGAICQKTETTTRSFADLSKKHKEQLMYGLNHYGFLGIENHIGDDAAKRRQNIRQIVRKTVAYYGLKKDNLSRSLSSSNHTASSSGSVTSHNSDCIQYNADDRLLHSLRKFSESNTIQDRYWARFMGHAASL